MEKALKECHITFDDRMLEELNRKKVKVQTELSEVVNLFDGFRVLKFNRFTNA